MTARASPPTALPHIFDRQFKADRSRSGQGSGLGTWRSRGRTRACWEETSPPQAHPAPAPFSRCDYLWPNRYPTAITPWPAPRMMRERSSPNGKDDHEAHSLSQSRLLALLTAACGSSGAVGVGTVKDLVPLPKVLPNSVVRIDPSTLKPMQVVPVGSAPDLVVASGGFVWVTHHVLRDVSSGALRNAGDRTLTRVDPSTGKATVVGGGLAPCGLAADPSGDVWVANCFEPGSGQTSNIVRVDAKTLAFKPTWPVPGGHGFYRGLTYGGGSIWVSDGHGGNTVTQVNPQTGAKKVIRLDRPTGVLVWSKAHGDLWIDNFDRGQPHATARQDRSHRNRRPCRCQSLLPSRRRRHRVGRRLVESAGRAHPRGRIAQTAQHPPTRVNNLYAGVWNVAAGAGYIWATTPRDGALWRINPQTNAVTRISMPHLPTGVTANANQVWVTVREK